MTRIVDLDQSANTFTIHVNSVNDAPAGTDNAKTINEDGSYTRRTGEPDPSENDGYESMTKPELQAELEARGLPTTGNKPELVTRLEEDDAAPVEE